MLKQRLQAVIVLCCAAIIAWFVYASETGSINRPFRLGLDLSGGTQLVYKADTSRIESQNISDSMAALRDAIENRVNLFGVSEPLVQTETGSSIAGEGEQRLLVELPGVTDTQQAIQLIGATPVLEFRALKPGVLLSASTTFTDFEPAKVTGAHVAKAVVEFTQNGGVGVGEPAVGLTFSSEGAELFKQLTTENIGRPVAIFLDGRIISSPNVRETIADGRASVSGSFTITEAKELARNLNYGALPLPISLISTNQVGSTLGAEAVHDGMRAGIAGFLAVIFFMIVWYRLPGLVASFSLGLYVIAMLALFKLVPVTLTAAGIAAFILTIGMAVDANVLIFERMKEELLSGKNLHAAAREGFARAWSSIRDSNVSSIITAIILFWFGTSLIKGFALVFGLGVIASMVSAITVTRVFMSVFPDYTFTGSKRFLFGSGMFK
jgi:preprotein translocase subunit SecD